MLDLYHSEEMGDAMFNILEEKFQDNFTKDNGWASVSGTWEYTDRGLECGKPSEYQDAIFLSPLSGRNFSS
jgi:hypothetical protein